MYDAASHKDNVVSVLKRIRFNPRFNPDEDANSVLMKYNAIKNDLRNSGIEGLLARILLEHDIYQKFLQTGAKDKSLYTLGVLASLEYRLAEIYYNDNNAELNKSSIRVAEISVRHGEKSLETGVNRLETYRYLVRGYELLAKLNKSHKIKRSFLERAGNFIQEAANANIGDAKDYRYWARISYDTAMLSKFPEYKVSKLSKAIDFMKKSMELDTSYANGNAILSTYYWNRSKVQPEKELKANDLRECIIYQRRNLATADKTHSFRMLAESYRTLSETEEGFVRTKVDLLFAAYYGFRQSNRANWTSDYNSFFAAYYGFRQRYQKLIGITTKLRGFLSRFI